MSQEGQRQPSTTTITRSDDRLHVRGTSPGRSDRPTVRNVQTVALGEGAKPPVLGKRTGTTASYALLRDAG